MAQTVAVVRAALTATGGSYTDLSPSGFGTPSAALLFCNNSNTSAVETSQHLSCIGVWTPTAQYSMRLTSATGQTSAYDRRVQSYTYGISSGHALGYTSGGAGSYIISAAPTDGIRATLSYDSIAVQPYVTALLLKGVSAKVMTVATPTTLNATTVSASVGFTPKLVIVLNMGFSGTTTETEYVLSFGVASSDGRRYCLLRNSDDGVNPHSTVQFLRNDCVAGQPYQGTAGGYDYLMDISAWGADTFTVKCVAQVGAINSDDLTCLVLGGDDLNFDMGQIQTAESTGETVITTTLDPQAVVGAFSTNSLFNTAALDSEANGFCLGMASTTDQYSHSGFWEDGVSPTVTGDISSATHFLNLDTVVSGTRTDLETAALALTNGRLRFNYSAVSGTSRRGFWFGFGPPLYRRPFVQRSFGPDGQRMMTTLRM